MFLTLMAITSLTGLYWVYSLVVTPRLIQTVLAESRQLPVELDDIQSEPPPGNVEAAQRHLPEAPWAARAKIQLPLTNGLVFANHWRPLDEKQELFEFKPFAMILYPADHDPTSGIGNSPTGKAPMTLVSERGLVRFSKKFDPVNNKNGRVINGKLEGQVIVRGNDGLSAIGRDLFFDEQSLELRSEEPFQFAFQQHKGTADRGLIVKLLPSKPTAKREQLVAIDGFERVLLRGHVEMDLVLNDGKMRVTCDEGFDFNPVSQIASFKINVNVVRPTAPDQTDSLNCQYLDLFLDEDSGDANIASTRARGDAPSVVPLVRGNGPPDALPTDLDNASPQSVEKSRCASGESVGRLSLRQLRATGNHVELESQSNGISAVMASLIYTVASRTALLNDPKAVIVRQLKTGTELRCPEITLTQNEAGEIETANGRGAGWVRRRQLNSDEVDFAAQWKSHFVLRQEPNSGLDVLELHGKAIAKQPSTESGLAAEVIKLWFERLERQQSSASTPAVAGNEMPNVRPRKMLALNNVKAVSPQWQGQTHRLELLFDHASNPTAELASETNGSAQNSESRVRPVGKSAKDDELKPDVSKPSILASNAEPLELEADFIRAHLKLISSDDDKVTPELTEVWTEGNVDVQQPHEDDSKPLHLTGQKLHLRNTGANGQVVHVTGRPAVICDRGFDIEGNDVFLDRLRNRTWIVGPGELRMPVKNDLDGRVLESPALLTIHWQEKMTFDGLTATFFDTVTAALNESVLQCQEMEVLLKDKLLFSGDRGQTPAAEVRQVVCKDGVKIDHSQYVDRDLVEIRSGRFAKLTLDQSTGETLAIGPGELAVWRPGRGKRAALAPKATAQANRPLETESTKWEFTRITFAGKTTGNIHDRQSTFHDRVHIVYGPVATPLATIDPDNLPRDGGWMQSQTLTVLQIQDPVTKNGHVELRAVGDAKLEGRSFFAQADSISFDESKELYTLRAKGNREVSIWRRTTPGGDDDVVSAKSIWFTPSQNKLISDKTSGIRTSN